MLTHFHLDHLCGLPYLEMLPMGASIWAPGAWLYGEESASILDPLRRPPIAPTDVTEVCGVNELRPGDQVMMKPTSELMSSFRNLAEPGGGAIRRIPL